jgi:putative hydrolase of the HAD superfamily
MIKHLSYDVGVVVFDAVGTLIEPSPSAAQAYADAAARQGHPLAVPMVRERFNQAFVRREAAPETSEARESELWRQIVADTLPEIPEPDRAFHELWLHFGNPKSWRVFPDVPQTLETLKTKGFRLAVASNFDARLRNVLAGHAALKPVSQFIVICSEVGWRKPHARFYQAIEQAVGMSGRHILQVGDSPRDDFFGPTACGFQALLLDRKRSGPQADLTIRDLRQLPELLVGPHLADQ